LGASESGDFMPPKKSNAGLFIGIGLIALLAAGGVAYKVMGSKTDDATSKPATTTTATHEEVRIPPPPVDLSPPATTAAATTTTKAARARFQEGVEFFDKGQFENARAAFLQAYALKKHPAVLLNLAQSCSKSNHWVDSAKYFQQYLRESQGLTAQQRTDGEKG